MKRCDECTYSDTLVDQHSVKTADGRDVVVRNIPALKCRGCGSIVMAPEVVRLLLSLSDAAPANEIEFPTPGRMTGEQIKNIRKGMKIPQYRLAELIGAKENTLALWEQGRRQPTGPTRMLLRLMDILARYREEAPYVQAGQDVFLDAVLPSRKTADSTSWSNVVHLQEYTSTKTLEKKRDIRLEQEVAL